jgi:hypothetical protein
MNARLQPKLRRRAMTVRDVDAVQAIEAPSYKLYPAQTTEASQMEAAYRTYGVMPTR